MQHAGQSQRSQIVSFPIPRLPSCEFVTLFVHLDTNVSDITVLVVCCRRSVTAWNQVVIWIFVEILALYPRPLPSECEVQENGDHRYSVSLLCLQSFQHSLQQLWYSSVYQTVPFSHRKPLPVFDWIKFLFHCQLTRSSDGYTFYIDPSYFSRYSHISISQVSCPRKYMNFFFSSRASRASWHCIDMNFG